MDSDNSKPPALSLDPIDPAAGSGAGGPPGSDGARPPLTRIASADRFLAQAADEYEKGIVDEPLWRSAVAQTRNDEALVVAAYLRARAIALQIQERGRRAESRARAESTMPSPTPAGPGANPPAAHQRPARPSPLSTRVIVAFAAVAGVAIAAAAALFGLSDDEAPVTSTSAPTVRKQAVASAAAAAEAVKEPAQDAVARAAAERTELMRKLESLEQAGNWNVQVLYAAEWTRKEPHNADAWARLSAGYLRLDQWDEAYEAAQQAVRIAPDRAIHWASLGNLYLRLERPNDARDALERALSLDAHDEDALCGALGLAASEGRREDAAAYRQQLGTREAGCTRHDEATRTVRPKGR